MKNFIKYLTFGVWTLVKFIFQLIVTLLGGIFLLPFVMTFIEPFECTHIESRPSYRFKSKWIDSIFGNSEDGLDGDVPYKSKYKSLNWWTRYNWTAWRNPIHNLALLMGVNEVITEYNFIGRRDTEDTVGREGWVYSEAIGASGKVYPMFRLCKIWIGDTRGIELNIGYKNFNIQEIGIHYQYSFTVSFNPIKQFEDAK